MTEVKEFIPGVSEDVNITDKAIKEVKKIMEEKKVTLSKYQSDLYTLINTVNGT